MSNEKEIQASILVCDDDKEIAEAISIYLQAEQYTVTTVNNGQEAVDLILTRKKNFDLIIMDVMMPVLDGIRTTKKLREFGVKTPIIFLSAKIDTNDKILGLNIGGDDYIEKPFNALELIARVKTVLRRDQGNKKNPLEIDPAFYDKKTNSIVIGDLKIETDTGYYECSKCHHKYVPKYSKVYFAMHLGTTRYLKCPKCNQRSWQKKVLTK